MKKAIWAMVLAVPAVLASASPSKAFNPWFCAGCGNCAAGLNQHGPLYNYGPFPYGYGSDPYGLNAGGGGGGGAGGDSYGADCGMPWKNLGSRLGNLRHHHRGSSCESGGCAAGSVAGGGCASGGCASGGCASGGCASGKCGLFAQATPTIPQYAAAPAVAYGSHYSQPHANYGAPAYGSVTAYGYAPAPVSAPAVPRYNVVPVSYGSYYGR